LEDEGPDAPVLPVVHVGAADAGVVDGDEDVVGGGEGGDGAVFKGEGEGFVEDEGEVLRRNQIAVCCGFRSWERRRTLCPSVAAILVDCSCISSQRVSLYLGSQLSDRSFQISVLKTEDEGEDEEEQVNESW
jgi:hypothetical protein